jgi:hypothetical protein
MENNTVLTNYLRFKCTLHTEATAACTRALVDIIPNQLLIMKVLSKTYFLAVLAKKKFPLSQNQLDGTRI